jgi:hypothetical protein
MPTMEWPVLAVADWVDTRDTLHLWTQIVGKIRLARTPLVNHWWNSTLYVTATGLTTTAIPAEGGRSFQFDFDFVTHQLALTTNDGGRRSIRLEPRSVADFHAEVVARMAELGVATPIWTMPVEIAGAIPFERDHEHASYDADAVGRWFATLGRMHVVLHAFRTRFVGKVSPVHFFWGAFDLAVTRFSGRTAPAHPGGVPNCGPFVMQEAYSHEVSSAGYWPGGADEGVLYAYAYPEPTGFRNASAGPAGARWDDDLGEFVLPLEIARRAADPEALMLEFLQATYVAAADLAGWNRDVLERDTRGLPIA